MFLSSSISGQDAGELSAGGEVREEHRPLSVLQIVPRMELGGVERGTLEVTEAITREGGRVGGAIESSWANKAWLKKTRNSKGRYLILTGYWGKVNFFVPK
jgi:hypothetical protein